jgi:RNA polymerase sigma-70 factor (ECF subfamily)
MAGARVSSIGNPYVEVQVDKGLNRTPELQVQALAFAYFPVDIAGQRVVACVRIFGVDYSNVDDFALIALIVRHDETALSTLYDRYSRLVFSLAMRIVGERTLAEEITADAFVSVWRAAASFAEERGRVGPWLMSITRHRAIDELRRLSVRPEGSAVDLNEAVNAAQSDSVDDLVGVKRQRELVRTALATLPPPQREALELAYFGGLTQQEIADKTGQPLGTIKTRMRLGMQKLRDELRRLDADIG